MIGGFDLLDAPPIHDRAARKHDALLTDVGRVEVVVEDAAGNVPGLDVHDSPHANGASHSIRFSVIQ
jgi:hypothetical protein